MADKHCPVCGRRYSGTYQNCPFCEEEAALRQGRRIRREQIRKAKERRARICMLLIAAGILALLGAGLLLYRVLSAEDGAQQAPDAPALEEVRPENGEDVSQEPLPGETDDPAEDGGAGEMPEAPLREESGEDLPHGVMPEAPVAPS